MLSIQKASQILGLEPRHLRNLAADGAIQGERVAGVWLLAPASVQAYGRSQANPGRPVAALSAWWLVARLTEYLKNGRGGEISPDDRKLRYRIRKLEGSLPSAEHLAFYLRKKAQPRMVWVHPGVAGRLADDARVHVGDLEAQLQLPVDDLRHFYVAERDVEELIKDYHARSDVVGDSEGHVRLMVVPDLENKFDWHRYIWGATLVDLLNNADARVSSAASALVESWRIPVQQQMVSAKS